jgi:hypothetical protein
VREFVVIPEAVELNTNVEAELRKTVSCCFFYSLIHPSGTGLIEPPGTGLIQPQLGLFNCLQLGLFNCPQLGLFNCLQLGSLTVRNWA